MNEPLRTEFLHIYRDLLRAASYLRDSAARSYIQIYVQDRFRSSASYSEISHRDPVRDRKHLAKARQSVRNLERAVDGDPTNLKKVLFLTYGRSGRRRRELVAQLQRREETDLSNDHNALQQLILHRQALIAKASASPEAARNGTQTENAGQEEINNGGKIWKPRKIDPNSKLGTMIRNQLDNHPRDSPRSKIRRSDPKIPKTNMWRRPMPLKRQKTITKKFWADTLEKLLPPVPFHEWHRLQDLALGLTPLEGPVLRRCRPAETKSTRKEDFQVSQHLSTPVRLTALDNELVFDVKEGIMSLKGTPQNNVRVLSQRSLRRMYASVWALTPTMMFDEGTQKWQVKWGSERSATTRGVVPLPTSRDAELFEVPEGGMPEPKIRKKRPTKKRK